MRLTGLLYSRRTFALGAKSCACCLELVEGGAISRGDIDAIIDADRDKYDFDVVIVDEAQDWPQPEAHADEACHGPAETVPRAGAPNQ